MLKGPGNHWWPRSLLMFCDKFLLTLIVYSAQYIHTRGFVYTSFEPLTSETSLQHLEGGSCFFYQAFFEILMCIILPVWYIKHFIFVLLFWRGVILYCFMLTFDCAPCSEDHIMLGTNQTWSPLCKTFA